MPHILVTNDDGIHAPGLRALVDAVKDLATVTKNLLSTFVQTTHGPKESKTVPSRKKANTGNFHKPGNLAKNWKHAALAERQETRTF